MPWEHSVTSCSRHLAGTAYVKGGRRPYFGQARPSKYTHPEPHPSPRLQYQHEVLYVFGVLDDVLVAPRGADSDGWEDDRRGIRVPLLVELRRVPKRRPRGHP